MKWHILVVVLLGLAVGFLVGRLVWRGRMGVAGTVIAGGAGSAAGGILGGKQALLPIGHLANQMVFGLVGAVFLIAVLNFMFPKPAADEPPME